MDDDRAAQRSSIGLGSYRRRIEARLYDILIINARDSLLSGICFSIFFLYHEKCNTVCPDGLRSALDRLSDGWKWAADSTSPTMRKIVV